MQLMFFNSLVANSGLYEAELAQGGIKNSTFAGTGDRDRYTRMLLKIVLCNMCETTPTAALYRLTGHIPIAALTMERVVKYWLHMDD